MAILSAASRRNGTGTVFQQLKMASLSEEDSAGESSSPSPPRGDRRPSAASGHNGGAAIVAEESAVNRTKYRGDGGGRRLCDARSDSGISDCSSLASSTTPHVRLSDPPSSIAEEKSPTALVPPTPTPVLARKVATRPAPVRPAFVRPALVRPSNPQPRPQNRRTISPAHVLLPAGPAVETNRLIFDEAARRDVGNGGAGVQRKEAIRIQTADNFKKAIAFWKQ